MTRWLILWLLLVGKINCQDEEEATKATRSKNEAEGEEQNQEQDQGQEKEQEQGQEQEQKKGQDADQEKNQEQSQDQDQDQEKDPDQDQEKDQEKEKDQDQDQDQEKGQEQEQELDKEQHEEPAREIEEEQEDDQEKNQGKRQEPGLKDDGPDPLVEQRHLEGEDTLGGRDTLRQAKTNAVRIEDDVKTSPTPDIDNKDTESPDISPFTEVSDNNLPDVDNRRTEEDITSTRMASLPFIALRQEPECLNEGGICGLYETCPVCMRGRPKLCPKAEQKRGEYRYQEVYDPRRDAAVCCFGFPVKETRCWKKSGVCIHIHEYCPSNRIFINATDCGEGKKCCMKRNAEHLHVIEY